MKNLLTPIVLCLLTAGLWTSNAGAQIVTLPDASQEAKVTQKIGITEVGFWYHSPGVKDRTIWGALVPYDRVWRAGANENTIFWTSHDIEVEGQPLAAGKYGLYMIPHEASVDIIFSSGTKNWGTVAPTEEEIVLKVNVKQETAPPTEWLTYGFEDREAASATAYLQWDEWRIPFTIEVDVPGTVVNNLRAELKGQAGFGYLGREQAANYCALNGVNLDEALTWINGSINNETRFSNLSIKAQILTKMGKEEEAAAIMEQALPLATPFQLNIYGYQLLNAGDTETALEVFLENVETCPKDHVFYWGFIDSAGEAYLKKGDIKNARKYYSMAKDFAPEAQQSYLDGVLKNLAQ